MADSPNTPDGFPAGKQNPPSTPSGKKGKQTYIPHRPPNEPSPKDSSLDDFNKKWDEALGQLTKLTDDQKEFTRVVSEQGTQLKQTAQTTGLATSTTGQPQTNLDWSNPGNQYVNQPTGGGPPPLPTNGPPPLPPTNSGPPPLPRNGPPNLPTGFGGPNFVGPPVSPTMLNWQAAGGGSGGGTNVPNVPPTPKQPKKKKQPKWWGGLSGLPGDSEFNMQPVDIGTAAGALSGNPKDIVAALNSVVKGFTDGAKDIQQGLGKATVGAMSKENFGDVGGSVFKGIEQGFHGARGMFGHYDPVLMSMEKAAGFVATLFESVETLRKFNDQLIQSNISFAEHSAAMTQVEVSMERFKIEMDQVRGGRRAERAMFHAESVQRLERSFAKWEDAWANFKGGILGEVNIYLASILEAINKRFGFKDDNLQGDGLVWDAKQAYEEIDWINQFGRLPANQNAHPRTPKV